MENLVQINGNSTLPRTIKMQLTNNPEVKEPGALLSGITLPAVDLGDNFRAKFEATMGRLTWKTSKRAIVILLSFKCKLISWKDTTRR